MSDYRFRYEKGDELKFLGHLDMMVAFQRALKRAKLPIAFSQGFNPHQLLHFASPLPLGYTTKGDYGDMRLKEELPAQQVRLRLNEELPEGLRVLQMTSLAPGAKNAMAALAAGEYEVILPQFAEMDFPGLAQAFFAQDQILEEKKTKKGMVLADIRPDLLALRGEMGPDGPKLWMQVAMGSTRNLRADVVVKALCHFGGVAFSPLVGHYTRLEMYQLEEGHLTPLGGKETKDDAPFAF